MNNVKDVKKKKIKKILGIVGNTILWIFVAFSCLLTLLVFAAQNDEDGIPSLFGKSLITIQTASMTGTFNIGDMVILTKIDNAQREELKEGDIVTYLAPKDLDGNGAFDDINTHRIDSIVNGVITTKGDFLDYDDNHNTNDPSLNYTLVAGDIIGVCRPEDRIPGLGGALDWLRSSTGFFLCVVLPLVLFFIYELYNFIVLLVSERAKRAPANVSKETEEEIKRRAIEEYIRQQAQAENKTQPKTDNSGEEQK